MIPDLGQNVDVIRLRSDIILALDWLISFFLFKTSLPVISSLIWFGLQLVEVDGRPRLFFRALRMIPPGDELLYDYGDR